MKNPFGMEFVLIPAGELRMDPNRHIFEKPANRVIIPEPFYLGKYLVTQKEWRSVMGNVLKEMTDLLNVFPGTMCRSLSRS